MKSQFLAALAVGVIASSSSADMYSDASGDLFDNGLSNLDITNVTVSSDENNSYISVTTATFASWTKYGIFFSSPNASGMSSNPWGRPHDLNGTGIAAFIGSWVDQPTDNSQYWNSSDGWNLVSTLSNSVSGNTVTWTLAGLGTNFAAGFTFGFDAGTSGGGNDPFVDLLSRSDQATSGWGNASVAGTFRSYTVAPAPGAMALLGVAGLISRRRRA